MVAFAQQDARTNNETCYSQSTCLALFGAERSGPQRPLNAPDSSDELRTVDLSSPRSQLDNGAPRSSLGDVRRGDGIAHLRAVAGPLREVDCESLIRRCVVRRRPIELTGMQIRWT